MATGRRRALRPASPRRAPRRHRQSARDRVGAGPALRAVPVEGAVRAGVARPRRPHPGRRHARRPPGGAHRPRHPDAARARRVDRGASWRLRCRSRAGAGCSSRPGSSSPSARPAQAQYELLDPEPARGLQMLPEPDEGDVYLDFEGDPWAEGGAGREYLAGIWTRQGEFVEFWAHDFAEEGRLTTDLLDWLTERWARFPGHARLPLRALRDDGAQAARRPARHARGRARPAAAPRGLRRPLRRRAPGRAHQQGLLLDQEARGVLLGPHAIAPTVPASPTGSPPSSSTNAGSPAATTAPPTRRSSTTSVATTRRTSARPSRCTSGSRSAAPSSRPSGHVLARPVPEQLEIGDEERAEIELAERLVDDGHELLAGLVGWHRREKRPEWWDFFRYKELETAELVEDGTAIGDLGEPEEVGLVKLSRVWRYPFPPQDCKVSIGKYVPDVDTHAPVGKVVGPRRGRGLDRAVDEEVARPAPSARARRAGAGHGPGAAREHRPHRPAGARRRRQPRDAARRPGRPVGCRAGHPAGRDAQGRRRPGRARPRR